MSILKKTLRSVWIPMVIILILCYILLVDRFHNATTSFNNKVTNLTESYLRKLKPSNNRSFPRVNASNPQIDSVPRSTSSSSIGLCNVNSSTWFIPEKAFKLPVDDKEYFWKIGKLSCLKEGIDFSGATSFNKSSLSSCKCKLGWFGKHCAIPSSVKHSNVPQYQDIVPIVNNNKRRVINAFPFNMEFDMLDARFHELGDLVDAFVILESNYTAYGDPKPLYLLDRLKKGYYRHVSCKIVHVFLNYFPAGARAVGAIAERLNRNFIGMQGLQKQISGISDEDLLILNDADELPSREVILFLKLHTGYPEPIAIQYRQLMYGFFWIHPQIQYIYSVVTMKFTKEVLKYNIMDVRSIDRLLQKGSKLWNRLTKYKTQYKTKPIMWQFGSYNYKFKVTTNSGWHCSWCFNPKGIHNKLVSAQNGDFPRWGDYPQKRNLEYIASLIKEGKYFDGSKKVKKSSPLQKYYAPRYFLDNFEKYKHILVNPYQQY